MKGEYMNTFKKRTVTTALSALFATFILATATINAHETTQDNASVNRPLKIRVVNFKTCVETSKQGQQEQGSFEALKKQMESVLSDKEKSLNEIAAKFEDPDYLDSLSPEAETEIKRKFRSLNQELTQLQNQYYQALNQTNVKVVQKLTDIVNEASKVVAKQNGFDLVFSDESAFFAAPDLDISTMVVAAMDQKFEELKAKEKENPAKPAAL